MSRSSGRPVPDMALPALYLRQFAEHIAAVGGDVAAWLALARLRPEHLDDEVLAVPAASVVALVQTAIELTEEPALGLLVGDRLRVNAHGILSFALISGTTVRLVIDSIERYLALRTTLVGMRQEAHAEEVRLVFFELVPLGRSRSTILEVVLTAVKHALDFGGLGTRLVRRVMFAEPEPSYARLARDLLKCEVHWGAGWTGLSLPLGLIDEVLRAADSAAAAMAEALCQRELDKMSRSLTLGSRVQRLVMSSAPGLPTLQVVARQLHLGERTLHRRLLDEGTSFRQLVEEVKQTLALAHLEAHQLTVEEIGYALGYTDPANFRRAFKRWHGKTPTEHRESRRQGSQHAV